MRTKTVLNVGSRPLTEEAGLLQIVNRMHEIKLGWSNSFPLPNETSLLISRWDFVATLNDETNTASANKKKDEPASKSDTSAMMHEHQIAYETNVKKKKRTGFFVKECLAWASQAIAPKRDEQENRQMQRENKKTTKKVTRVTGFAFICTTFYLDRRPGTCP